MGPGAGKHGGEVIAAGSLSDIMESPRSLTGDYLSGRRAVPLPLLRRSGNGKRLSVKGARANNPKDTDVPIPPGTFCCITGVQGTGKTTKERRVGNGGSRTVKARWS